MTASTVRSAAVRRAPVPPPAAQLSATAALGAIAVGVVAVIALWWQDTCFVQGFGDRLTNAGRITGLLAGYAIVVLLALLALMARAARRRLYLTGRDIAGLRADPGQFFRRRFLTKALWWAANPYSLSVAPRANLLRITVKTSGAHSTALRHLRPGTRVLAEGPSGGITAARRTRRKVLLLAGRVGLSAPKLQRLIPGLRERDVFLCGPEPMMMAAEQSSRQAGVPPRHIHHEPFAF